MHYCSLPLALGEAGLRAECAKVAGAVESVHIGVAAFLQPGEAFVVFANVK